MFDAFRIQIAYGLPKLKDAIKTKLKILQRKHHTPLESARQTKPFENCERALSIDQIKLPLLINLSFQVDGDLQESDIINQLELSIRREIFHLKNDVGVFKNLS